MSHFSIDTFIAAHYIIPMHFEMEDAFGLCIVGFLIAVIVAFVAAVNGHPWAVRLFQ